MSKGGPKLHCPKCAALENCRSLKVSEPTLGRARALYYKHHKDIQWYRRRRRCNACNHSFLTAEVEERFLDELLELRNRLIERRRARIASVRVDWLKNQETAPRELAEQFIRASCWWMTHSSGKPVRAARFADRIRLDPEHGWAVDFGANAFLVEKALRRSAKQVDKFLGALDAGASFDLKRLRKDLRSAISGAVANANGYEYAGYYPIDGNDLVFGAHVIDLEHAIDFLCDELNVDELRRDLENIGG